MRWFFLLAILAIILSQFLDVSRGTSLLMISLGFSVALIGLGWLLIKREKPRERG